MKFLEMIFGNQNDREVKRLNQIVAQIEALEPRIQALSDDQLREKTTEFKNRLANGESLEDIRNEAFAVAREAGVRTLGKRAYPVQLLGGLVISDGRIAEMRTGEGKTLTATLPAYLHALSGKGVHVITVNDYLAKRDKEWMGKVFTFLGLTVSCVIHGVQGQARKDAYQADITYGTNNEFGFDYLRDNMSIHKDQLMQRPLNFAIVDEVDSILVDEARTPLIISGEGRKSTQLYQIADMFVQTLKKEVDFTIDEKAKSCVLTDESGVEKAENFFKIENLSDPENMEINHHVNQALKARAIMRKDVDYVIKEGEIVIVDDFTGRLMFGRRYSNGLHQAIEAKENMEVRKESQTLATITIQNYFRMYDKLSGMTGTAKTEEDEFQHIYGMDVVVVPTNKPIARKDLADSVYKSTAGKFAAVINDIKERHVTGQPILVGTISIETSELLSSILKKNGVKHEVLNAKQHEREAEIVAQAGRFGQVTIATNMAGRGTDIVLGGNPEFMSKRELSKQGYSDEILAYVTSPLEYDDEEINEAREKYNALFAELSKETDAEAAKVKAAGGLHIIGTERHESRRIDNQLRGRSGRQGDAGSSQFFISFDDDLMRLFVNDNVKAMIDGMGMDDETPLEARMLTRSIEGAQRKVEGRNFGIRKHVLQYDDVMNKQREIIYAERNRVLHGENIYDQIQGMIEGLVDNAVGLYASESDFAEEWDLKAYEDHLHSIFLPKGMLNLNTEDMTRESLKEHTINVANKLYDEKTAEVGEETMREIERVFLLRVVDTKWIDHIDAMDQLKQGIGLRAIGQEDPVRAYQFEGFDMFNEMTYNIQMDTIHALYGVTVQTDTERKAVAKVTGTSGGGDDAPAPLEPLKKGQKVGRNDPCPCGSGLKYKKCHGKNA